jgi:PPP family 3-phenylpropionic acid transporter
VLLLLAALVQAAALAPTTAIADALSVNAARPQTAGSALEYGWIRGAGSAASVLGTLAVGQLITSTDLAPVAWVNAILLIAAAGATAWVPRPTTQASCSGHQRRNHQSPCSSM